MCSRVLRVNIVRYVAMNKAWTSLRPTNTSRLNTQKVKPNRCDEKHSKNETPGYSRSLDSGLPNK